MYRVDTNSDGSVNLEGKERYKLPGQTGSYMFEIKKASDALVRRGFSWHTASQAVTRFLNGTDPW